MGACYTCRIRLKKCDEQMTAEGGCQTCASLHLQCLRGFGPKRLDWLRESHAVIDTKEKIKSFLASQGVVKGHSGSRPRTSEQEPQILDLSVDYDVSPSSSPPSPTLSTTSSHEEYFSSEDLQDIICALFDTD